MRNVICSFVLFSLILGLSARGEEKLSETIAKSTAELKRAHEQEAAEKAKKEAAETRALTAEKELAELRNRKGSAPADPKPTGSGAPDNWSSAAPTASPAGWPGVPEPRVKVYGLDPGFILAVHERTALPTEPPPPDHIFDVVKMGNKGYCYAGGEWHELFDGASRTRWENIKTRAGTGLREKWSMASHSWIPEAWVKFDGLQQVVVKTYEAPK